jgi:hypothetical protein
LFEGINVSAELDEEDELRVNNTWFEPEAFGGRGGVKPSFLESDIRDVSMLPGVKGVMSLGSVLAVELKANSPSPSPSSSPLLSVYNIDGQSSSASNKNSRYYNSNASSVVVSLLKQNNVYARPLGNTVYLMPTPLTPEVDRLRLIRVIKR